MDIFEIINNAYEIEIFKAIFFMLPKEEKKDIENQLTKKIIENIDNGTFSIESFKKNYKRSEVFIKDLFGNDCNLMEKIKDKIDEKENSVKFGALKKGDKFKLTGNNFCTFMKISLVTNPRTGDRINAICIEDKENCYIGDRFKIESFENVTIVK